MTTWNELHVTGWPGTLDDLTASLAGTGILDRLDHEPLRPAQVWRADEEAGTIRQVPDAGAFFACGESKYHLDDVASWARELTAQHPGVVVTHDEAWDDDGGGRTSSTYRGGDLDPAASTEHGPVPLAAAEQAARLRHAVSAIDADHPAHPLAKDVLAFLVLLRNAGTI